MQKKIIMIVFGILLAGCSPMQKYEKIVEKDYKRSKVYKGFKEKSGEEENTYYKLKKKVKSTKEPIFYFIEKTEKEAKMYLAVNYRDKNWLYMKAIEFIDKESGESYMLDFYDYKIYKSIWKDNTTFSLKVEEHIAFPLEKEEIEAINKYLIIDKVDIKLYSDYDGRSHERKLNKDEKDQMLKVFDLYNKINREIEDKLAEELKKLESEVDENKILFEEEEKKNLKVTTESGIKVTSEEKVTTESEIGVIDEEKVTTESEIEK